MSLPVTNLDDRDYQDIVDEAKRLIPKYCPEWTNHNLSDPGVALIELFAWMSEMVMYRLNQVPDAFYTRMLNLIGIEPFPATAATTDLTFWVVPGQSEHVVIPAGTEASTAGESPYVFSTTTELVLRNPTLHSALTGDSENHYVDRWDELGHDRSSVVCFTESLLPGDAVYLGFDESLAGHAVKLDVEANIEGIGVDPNDPPLQWEVWAGEAWLPVKMYQDTTGGLNRNGAIIMLVPLAHEPLTLANTQAHWLRGRLLANRPGQAPYRASPEISSLEVSTVGGTVNAEHSQTMPSELLGLSEGVPDERYHVKSFPVLTREEGETVRVISEQGSIDWDEVDDFIRSTEDDRHFTWDDASGEIRFGPRVRYPDGSTRQHGAIPPAGAQITVTTYRHGGGAGGNVGSGTLRVMRTTIPYVDRVENIESAFGGVDSETVENAKIRGPFSLRSGQRAVTRDDYERLALESDPAIARARCLAPTRSGNPIRLLLVPAVENVEDSRVLDSFALPAGMVDTVFNHLEERRILGAEVEVGTPFFQGVTVAALLKSLPGRPEASVKQRAIDTLYRYVDPLVGGPEGKGWPFEADLNAATVFQLLEGVDGVERVDEVLFFEFDLRNGVRHGAGKELVKLASDSLFMSARHQVVMR